MLKLEYSSEHAQLQNSKDSSQIECSIWFLHQRAISNCRQYCFGLLGPELFSKEEWLSTLQVARYFSRLSALNKRGVLKQNVTASQEEEEEDDPDYVSEIAK